MPSVKCEFCGKGLRKSKESHIREVHPERYEEWKAAKAEAKSRRGGSSQLDQLGQRMDRVEAAIEEVVKYLSATSKPAPSIDLDDTFSQNEKKLAFWAGVFGDICQKLGIKVGGRAEDPLEDMKASMGFLGSIIKIVYGIEDTILDVQGKRLRLARYGGAEGFRKDKKGRYVIPPDELDELVEERYGERLEEEARKKVSELIEGEVVRRHHLERLHLEPKKESEAE